MSKHLTNLHYQVIPHRKQRYPTTGDYFIDNAGTWQFRVSHMTDWKYEACIFLHEFIEAILAKHYGIEHSDIDKFDMEYEKKRQPGDLSEPGNDEGCPVYHEHQVASGFERLLAAELGVDWQAYEKEQDELMFHGPTQE